MLLRGATVIDLEPANVERADLRVDGDRIVARAPILEPLPGEEAIDLSNRLLFPGLVSAHHHFYASLLRGVPRQGGGFGAETALLQRLEQVLEGDHLEASSSAGGLEGLCNGTTCVFDLHCAPAHARGSLTRIAHGLSGVGLRAVLGYQLSERAGVSSREEGLLENVEYLTRARGRFRGALAVEALAALSDEGLQAVRDVHRETGALLVCNVAEDPLEEQQSLERFGATVTDRLFTLELPGPRVVLSQGVHLSWPELSRWISSGTWLAHAPRSNMSSQTGLATASKFGVRACLGTDTMPLDVFAEAQAATLRANDSGQPIDILRFLANGHRLATEVFGTPVGPLQPGAVADLVVLDYQPPTPLATETLGGHVLHGLGGRCVESVMVDGLWRLWKRKAIAVDAAEVARHASDAARDAWAKMRAAG